MQSATPQGLAGLMQQRPQAPQMPTPGKASPMAGLGSVDDRVSAYQGNTKPLEQRYAMTQDLLDLLALQKIKSQKEAAARQMQLQMAQQGQQDGQANMTVAQQRAQEVDALTKNELAQQRGDTAQKQAGDQQAMMQKLMGGIAGAPGANAAAQPKAMAAGGIVGYAGPEGSVVGKKPLDEEAKREIARAQMQGDREALMGVLRKLGAAGYDVATVIPRGLAGAIDTAIIRPARAITGKEIPYLGSVIDTESATPAMDKLNRAQPSPPASVSEAQATAAAGPQAAVPPTPAAAPKPPVPAAPAAPKPPAPAGIAGLPGAAPAGPAAPAAPSFGDRFKKASIDAAELDNMQQGRTEEARVEKRMALTPEQRGVYDEGIAGLQGMYQEQYDPERMRREGIKRALIGAGGRRYGELGAAASAGMAYDDRMRAAKLKEFGDVQKARTDLIGIDRANVKNAIDAGAAVAKEGAATKRQGLASSASAYSTDVGSSDKALDREVEKLKVAAQNAATAAQREGLSQDKNRNLYLMQLNRVEQLERNLDKDFASGPLGMLLMQDPAKLKPEDKNRLEIAKLELEQKKAKIRRDMEPVLADVRRTLGISDAKMSKEEEAALQRNLNRGK